MSFFYPPEKRDIWSAISVISGTGSQMTERTSGCDRRPLVGGSSV